MREYGNLSYREIAESLQISESNVKVRMHRARERLAQALKEADIYVP
jgi:RNA polymerase sigma-70 factor (ECF subfamily)